MMGGKMSFEIDDPSDELLESLTDIGEVEGTLGQLRFTFQPLGSTTGYKASHSIRYVRAEGLIRNVEKIDREPISGTPLDIIVAAARKLEWMERSSEVDLMGRTVTFEGVVGHCSVTELVLELDIALKDTGLCVKDVRPTCSVDGYLVREKVAIRFGSEAE